MPPSYSSGSPTFPSPLRQYRGDRWLDVREELARDLVPLHHEALAGLARLHGWAGGPPEQGDELAVQLVLAAQPPQGWPARLSPISYRLHAIDGSGSIAANEHWTVDPNRADLGCSSFERLARDRLSRLPRPHQGSIIIHAEAALQQKLLTQGRVTVAVGIPRPRPLGSREQVELARIRAQEMRHKEETMVAMMMYQPGVVGAAASALEVARSIDFPPPTAPPPADQQAQEEEIKGLVRMGAKLVKAAAMPPQPAAPTEGEPPTEPPAKKKLFDGWGLDD